MKPSAAFSFTTASDGFTLIELTLVIVITGILAVFVAPRVIDINAWRITSFADQLQNATMFANRLAISQRKAIQVAYATTGATITYVSPGPLNGTAVIDPTTNVAFNLTCPTTISNCITSGAGGNVIFNNGGSGQSLTSTGGPLVVTVASGAFTQNFTIENTTGLVRRS